MLHPHQKINDPLTTSEARIDGVNVRFSASFCSHWPSLPLDTGIFLVAYKANTGVFDPRLSASITRPCQHLKASLKNQ